MAQAGREFDFCQAVPSRWPWTLARVPWNAAHVSRRQQTKPESWEFARLRNKVARLMGNREIRKSCDLYRQEVDVSFDFVAKYVRVTRLSVEHEPTVLSQNDVCASLLRKPTHPASASATTRITDSAHQAERSSIAFNILDLRVAVRRLRRKASPTSGPSGPAANGTRSRPRSTDARDAPPIDRGRRRRRAST